MRSSWGACGGVAKQPLEQRGSEFDERTSRGEWGELPTPPGRAEGAMGSR
jgi:hypothetical protein